MSVVIGLNPNRVVANRENRGKAKYAQQAGRKFKWVLDIEQATKFSSFQAALGAFGRRCQEVGKVTDDVLFHEVATRTVRPAYVPPTTSKTEILRTLNGTEGTDRYRGV